jgi:integrase
MLTNNFNQIRNYETRQIVHPTLMNRKITLVYIDNKLDLASFSFLVDEARNGGQSGSVSGYKTHIGRAYKIIELYRELEIQGLNWWEAEEHNILIARNRMLCWDMNSNPDYGYYDYEPIENDTMNQKLAVWLKFFNHQNKMRRSNRMIANTEMVKQWLPDTFLQHTSGIKHKERFKMLERWKLMVKPSPKKLHYPALNELEFIAFRSQLRTIDIVYENIALLMVKTGLRIDAALNFNHNSFISWLRHIYNGKTFDCNIPFEYISKGGQTKVSEIPIETVHEIQKSYRSSHYKRRLSLYQTNKGGENEPLWLREDGKPVYYRDVQLAFQKASHEMGRVINNITPHHMRHTFATWVVLEASERHNIPLGVIGSEPHPMLLAELMARLGHINSISTVRYTMTAYKLLPRKLKPHGNRVLLTTISIEQNKAIQKLLLEKAIDVYGEDFCDQKYDVKKFALKQGFAVSIN